MSETSSFRLWSMRAAFVGLAVFILLGNLLPLQTMPRGWAGPDLLLCFGMAWSVRRPDYVPMVLLGAVFLLGDLLLSRPPGLAAALMLVACFDLQSRMRRLRDAGFAAEWARACVLIVGVALAHRLILGLLLVPTAALSLTVFQVIFTAMCYPIVVALSAILFGVRIVAPGDLDSYGQRL